MLSRRIRILVAMFLVVGVIPFFSSTLADTEQAQGAPNVDVKLQAQEQRQEQEVERAVTFDELPPAVKETILKEAGDHELLEIEEICIGETLYYETEWFEDGMEVEIRVAPDGTLLGKALEPPDEEGEEDVDEDAEDDEEGADD